MSPFDQELVEFFGQRMLQRSRAAQLIRQARAPRVKIHDRLLINVGDMLISLGLKLKNLPRPDSDHEYTPLYT
jgi:hypothetical protein